MAAESLRFAVTVAAEVRGSAIVQQDRFNCEQLIVPDVVCTQFLPRYQLLPRGLQRMS